MKKLTVLFLSSLFLATGCASRKAKAPTVTPPVVEVPAGPDVEPSTRGKEAIVTQDLETVLFDYDDSKLKPEAQASLQRNAAFMKEQPEVEFVVEGHCDQRGTTAYNLALGQRRASSVRDYYKSLGVAAKQIATISYGEERLNCREETDACHSRNRRGVTAILRNGTALKKK